MRLLREVLPWPAVLTACALLCACATPQGASHQYAQSVDSASNGCRHAPALCRPQPGEQMATLPPVSAPQATALSAAAAIQVVKTAIDSSLETRIRQALKECADEARRDVMFLHFQRSPSRDECMEIVGHDSQGRPITRAMLLGREQHQRALACAERRLKELKPGGFSLSPRYRYDPDTGTTQYIPPEQVQALLDQGRAAELLGTLEPDVVIHLPDHPLFVQLVFDFKFPCVNGGQTPWREYPPGHPYAGLTQKALYERALGTDVLRVLPHWGILP